MKKLFLLSLLLMCVLFMKSSVYADTVDYIPHKIIVKFENDFSSNNPPSKFNVVIDDDYDISNCRHIEKDTKLFLQLEKVKKESVGKLNASVKAKVIGAYIPSEDGVISVNNPNAVITLSKYEPIDKTNKAVDTGISVVNHFVNNIAYPAHFVKGMVQNEEGNILKSGLKETYDSSVFSYASKGEPLELKSGDLATLTFFTKNIQK